MATIDLRTEEEIQQEQEQCKAVEEVESTEQEVEGKEEE